MDEKLEVPLFIKKRGCINCEKSKMHMKKHKKPFGADHELMASCLLLGCQSFGFSLLNPFTDPEELIKLAEKEYPDKIQNAIKYCKQIDKELGNFYQKIGVSLKKLIADYE